MALDLEALKTLFASLDVGFAVMHRPDPDDGHSIRIIYVNEAGARAIDVPPEEYVDRRLIDAFPNIESNGLLGAYNKCLDRGEAMELGEVAYADARMQEAVYRVRAAPVSGDIVVISYTNVTEAKRIVNLIEEQNRLIREMSTPTIELWSEIVLLPLIGTIDSTRATQMIEHLLEAIVTHEARVAIFDITGVPTVDTHAAQCLMQAVSAAKMLGTQVFLTGIKPETAITLVKLGVDISELHTHGSLHQGVLAAYRTLGYELVKSRDK